MATADVLSDWIKRLSVDPYAVLGLPVTADERRITKQYRQAAKRLHPDSLVGLETDEVEFSGQWFSRLVNPAYQRLKQDKGRAETLATLRLKVRRLSREDQLHPKSDVAQQLLAVEEDAVEVRYEQLVTELAMGQYDSADNYLTQTTAIAELNLVYLRRKMGNLVIREKRAGLITSAAAAVVPPPVEAPPTASYGQRHVERAKTYIQAQKYLQAIQELRDAVRLEPTNSDYHTLLGQVYLKNQMAGMAKVHIRHALKLTPDHSVALKYAQQLGLDLPSPPSPNGHAPAGESPPPATVVTPKRRGVFGLFVRKP